MTAAARDAPILVALDDATARLALPVLRRLGREVLRAAAGEPAFRLACEARPALVVLDLASPRPIGRDLLDALRQQHAGPRPLVLAVVRRVGPESEAPLDPGVDDAVSSPIDSEELLQRAAALLDDADHAR
jgi:CheY-like chemotaxis protein